MKKSLAYLSLATTLLLAACTPPAGVTPGKGDLGEQVDRLVAAQEYGKALDLLGSVKEGQPDFPKVKGKRAEVEAKARAFEQETVATANKLVQEGKWVEAHKAYLKALDKHPKSTLLRDENARLQTLQENRRNEVELELLINQAKWLQANLPLFNTMSQVDSDNRGAARRLAKAREDAGETAKRLTEIGLAALRNQNIPLAGRTLPLAASIDPSPETRKALESYTAADAVQQRQQQESRERAAAEQRERETRRVWADYNDAISRQRLIDAIRLVKRLEQIDGSNPEVAKARRDTDTAIAAAVKERMDQGAAFYGQGNFEQSIAAWRRVLEIDSDNQQAKDNIERAERVMSKLRQIREKKGSAQ